MVCTFVLFCVVWFVAWLSEGGALTPALSQREREWEGAGPRSGAGTGSRAGPRVKRGLGGREGMVSLR